MAKIGPRDNQKSKLYRGERVAFKQFFEELGCETIDEARAVVRLLWKRADVPEGVPAPEVVENPRLRVTAHYDSMKHTICTNEKTVGGSGLSLALLAHETAHAVMNANGLLFTKQAHGPEFCYFYARMIAAFEKIDFATAVRLLRAEGIKVRTGAAPLGRNVSHWVFTRHTGEKMFHSGARKRMKYHIRRSKFNVDNFTATTTTPELFFTELLN